MELVVYHKVLAWEPYLVSVGGELACPDNYIRELVSQESLHT